MTNQGKNPIDIVLAESLKELSVARPIEKITIKEITDKAGVIRPTFYNHFQDKYELLEWIVDKELVEPIQPFLDNGMLKEGMVFILTTMEKEKEFYKKAVRLEGQNSFQQALQKSVAIEIERHLKSESVELEKQYSWAKKERVAQFYSNSLCYPLLEWLKRGLDLSVSDMADMYEEIFRRFFGDINS